MRSKVRRIACRAIAVAAVSVLACAGLAMGPAPAAFAYGARAGGVSLIDPHTLAPVPSGGSATPWTLTLPAQAACSGDTAHSGYHVYSFLAPSTVDPASLTFNPSTGPSQGFPLVSNTGSPYVAANTASTTGQIIQVPTFDFNLFATTDQGGTKIVTPPGSYRIGIACANTNGQPDKYWDALVTFTASGTDPNGETWTTFAKGVRSGGVSTIDPHTLASVPSGGSATSWTLNRPAQAACSGDTANNGYHVYSFLAPSTVDPGTLTFNPSTGPSSGSPLFDQTGSPYVAANTASTTGQIIQVPTFDFNLFATTDQGGTKIVTPPGSYRMGIACANTNGQPDKYWDSVLTFTASNSDPNGETWTIATSAGAPTIGPAVAGNQQATVSWTAPASDGGSPITAYVVTPYIGAVAQLATTFNNTLTTQTVTGLTNGTSYTFTVAAINGVGTGAQSAASNTVTPATVPGAPTIGTAVAGNGGQATVSWTAPAANGGSAITAYVVTPYIGGVAQTATTFNNTLTTQTVTGLTNGTSYTFTVAAINGVGTGPQSAVSNAVVPGIAPGMPTIGAAIAGVGQATVSWTAPAPNNGPPITAYVVTAYVGFNPAASVIVGPTMTSRTVTGLTNGTTYRFRVRAVNAAGASNFSTASNPVVPGITPNAPTIGTAVAGNAQATATWTAPTPNNGPPITAYVVTAYVGFNPAASVIVGPTMTSRTVTGLTNGTTYRFRVRAVNAAGASSFSTASNAVTPGP